jgi:BASS family bile acid:Na+ symporter
MPGNAAVLSVLAYVMVVGLQFGISCSVDVTELRETMQRQRQAVVAGIMGQWTVMPTSAFLLSRRLGLNGHHSVALVLVGCCPGGATSNLFAYFANADVALSVGTTLLSNTLAIATLPLLLYAWTQSMEEVVVPYGSVVGSMCLAILPTALGLYVRHRSERWARVGERAGGMIGAIVIGSTVVFGIAGNIDTLSDSELLPWTTWVGCAALGPIGAMYALGVGRAFALAPRQRNALVFEVMLQNLPLATAIINITFADLGPSLLFQMQLFPIIYGCVVFVQALLATMIMRRLQGQPVLFWRGDAAPVSPRQNSTARIAGRGEKRISPAGSPRASQLTTAQAEMDLTWPAAASDSGSAESVVSVVSVGGVFYEEAEATPRAGAAGAAEAAGAAGAAGGGVIEIEEGWGSQMIAREAEAEAAGAGGTTSVVGAEGAAVKKPRDYFALFDQEAAAAGTAR